MKGLFVTRSAKIVHEDDVCQRKRRIGSRITPWQAVDPSGRLRAGVAVSPLK